MKIESVRALLHNSEPLGLRFNTDEGVFDVGKDSLQSRGILNLDTEVTVELISMDDVLLSEEDLEDSIVITDISEDYHTLSLVVEALASIQTYHSLFHPNVIGYYDEVAASVEAEEVVAESLRLSNNPNTPTESLPLAVFPSDTHHVDRGSGVESLKRFILTVFERLDIQEELQKAILTRLDSQDQSQSKILTHLNTNEDFQKTVVTYLEQQVAVTSKQDTLLREQNELLRQTKLSVEEHDKELMKTLRSFQETRRQELEDQRSKRWWHFRK